MERKSKKVGKACNFAVPRKAFATSICRSLCLGPSIHGACLRLLNQRSRHHYMEQTSAGCDMNDEEAGISRRPVCDAYPHQFESTTRLLRREAAVFTAIQSTWLLYDGTSCVPLRLSRTLNHQTDTQQRRISHPNQRTRDTNILPLQLCLLSSASNLDALAKAMQQQKPLIKRKILDQ
jgi:hypothetical protein